MNFITPNMITRFGTVYSLAAAILLAILDAQPFVIALLALFSYHLAYMADLVDGEIARIKNLFSNNAGQLDRIQDYAILALVIASVLRTSDTVGVPFVGALYACVAIFRFGISEQTLSANKAQQTFNTGPTPMCLRYPFTWSGVLIINFLGVLLGTQLYALLLGPLTLILLAHGIYKFLKI